MKVRVDKMKSDLEILKKLADDIVLTEQRERELYYTYKTQLNTQKRKSKFLKKYSQVAAVALVIMFIIFVSSYTKSPNVLVYAANGHKVVKLKLNKKVELIRQKTPLGYGYELEIDVEEGKFYYTIESKDNLNLDNIFRNGNKIIWMPDGVHGMNFRDEKGNAIEIQETNNSTLNIEVCNYGGETVETITLILERSEGRCSVEMKIAENEYEVATYENKNPDAEVIDINNYDTSNRITRIPVEKDKYIKTIQGNLIPISMLLQFDSQEEADEYLQNGN